MNTNFTVRDFFVYLITGVIAMVSMSLVYVNEMFNATINFFTKYKFIEDFSILAIFIFVPIIYIIGHLIGAISYNLLKLYTTIYNYLTPSQGNRSSFKHKILMFFKHTLYTQRNSYAIIEHTKTHNPHFSTLEEFWILCAKLQKEKNYSYAEYWFILNELFNSLNIIFFISSILSFIENENLLGLIFLLLAYFSFKRAMQYAEQFIKTIIRLDKHKLSNTGTTANSGFTQ